MKIAVIGCGNHSNHIYGPSLRKYADEHNGAELVACCDLSKELAEAYSQNHGFGAVYTDWKAMCNEVKPDVVLLIVPVTATAGLGCELLKLGIPVYMEKPPGISSCETKGLIKAAEENGTPHLVGFNRRHCPQLMKLREMIENCGEAIDFISYDIYRYKRFETSFAFTAIHAIDAVRYIAGADYENVSFEYQDVKGTSAVNMYLNGTMTSGAVVRINMCIGSGAVLEKTEVSCPNHYFAAEVPAGKIDITDKMALRISHRELAESYPLEKGEFFEIGGFYNEVSLFLDAVKDGRLDGFHGSLKDSLQSVEVSALIETREKEYKRV